MYHLPVDSLVATEIHDFLASVGGVGALVLVVVMVVCSGGGGSGGSSGGGCGGCGELMKMMSSMGFYRWLRPAGTRWKSREDCTGCTFNNSAAFALSQPKIWEQIYAVTHIVPSLLAI